MTVDKWTNWLELHRDLWTDNEVTRELRTQIPDIDLAIGIYAAFGSRSLVWLDGGHIPALEASPKEALKSPEGISRLKLFLVTVHGF